jgi:hypothetical protein
MKISLNEKSAQAMRDFAEAMPFAINNIVEETQRLIDVYNSVSDQVGPHQQDFETMMKLISQAQADAADAIKALPPKLRYTADKIDAFIATHPEAVGK